MITINGFFSTISKFEPDRLPPPDRLEEGRPGFLPMTSSDPVLPSATTWSTLCPLATRTAEPSARTSARRRAYSSMARSTIINPNPKAFQRGLGDPNDSDLLRLRDHWRDPREQLKTYRADGGCPWRDPWSTMARARSHVPGRHQRRVGHLRARPAPTAGPTSSTASRARAARSPAPTTTTRSCSTRRTAGLRRRRSAGSVAGRPESQLAPGRVGTMNDAAVVFSQT